MKRIAVYLFSGTGNTRKVAAEFAAKARENGAETAVFEIDGRYSLPQAGDAVGIAYPVHAFNAPQNVLEFAERLPDGEGRTAFFIKTCGEPLSLNDASSAVLKKILTKKGYDVAGEYRYVMPYNMLYRHTESMATKMWFAAKRRIESDVKSLLAGERRKVRSSTPISVLFRAAEQPFMRANGKLFGIDEERCIGCGRCVRDCPRGNITVKDGRIQFGGSCIGCVRCSFLCPADAVKIGLINFWKVNGAYRYGSEEPERAECKYLKRAYRNYFEKSL